MGVERHLARHEEQFLASPGQIGSAVGVMAEAIRSDIRALGEKVDANGRRIDENGRRIDGVVERLDRVQGRLGAVEHRLDRVEVRGRDSLHVLNFFQPVRQAFGLAAGDEVVDEIEKNRVRRRAGPTWPAGAGTSSPLGAPVVT